MFASVWRFLTPKQKKSARLPRPRRAAKTLTRRLQLESLEDRLTPATVTSLFNTGVDAAHAGLPGGSVDPNYTLTASPTGPGSAFTVLNPLGLTWAPDNSTTSDWISADSAGSNGNTGSFTYETTFDLTGFVPSTAQIKGQFEVDDTNITAVLLNGTNTGVTGGSFNGFTPFTISSGFVAGGNTLDFQVSNTGGPTGLRVEMTGTADPVPEPIITSVSPSPLTEGTNVQITVNGSRFFPDSVVQVNGTNLNTTYVSPTKLTAFVPAADVPEEGTANITVANPPAEGGTSADTPVTITDPAVVGIGATSTVGGVFNSGVDANGTPLAGGANDPHYTVMVDSSAPTPAVVVTNPLGLTWSPDNGPNSDWISAASSGSPSGTTFTYETTFDLTGFVSSTAKITGQFEGDDQVTDVLVNGVSTGVNSGGFAFNAFVPFTITSGFQPGVNTIDFVVPNTGGGPTGFRVEMSATAAAAAPISPVALTAVEGQDTGPVTLATFTDPAGLEATTHYSATVSWGDNTPPDASATIVDNGNGTYSVQGGHTYTEESGAAPYGVTVTIHHESAPDAVVNDTATVSDPSVIATGAISLTPVEGQDTGLVKLATFTDPGGLESTGDYNASVDWGDGTPLDTTTPTIVNNQDGTYSVVAHHTYAEESGPDAPNSTPYQVSVSITHGAGSLVVNGGFEQPLGFGQYASIPGWTLAAGTGGGTIEIGGNNIGTPFEGNQFTELNSQGPATIDQTIATTPGQTYLLTFAFSARPGTTTADNDVQVSFAGNPIATVTADGTGLGDTQWKVYTFQVTATGASSVLEFASLSPPGDQVGGLLDAVRLVPDAAVTDTATASDPAVKATGGVALTPIEGTTTGTVTLATFTDPAGLEPKANYSATVDWGDGSALDNITPTIVDNGDGTYSVQASHTYAEESGPDAPNSTPYQITVTIGHEGALTATVHDTATASDPAVKATGGVALTPIEGTTTGTVTLATFTDPAGLEPKANYSATVDWGDGSPLDATATIIDNGNGTYSVKGSHTYHEASDPDDASTNPYSITVTIHHEDAADLIVRDAATVSDPAVTPTTVAVHGVEGQDTGVVTVATFTDPAGLDALGEYSATVNWGDGTPLDNNAVIVDNHDGTYGVRAHHLFTEEGGAFTVTIYHNNTPAVANGTTALTDPDVVVVGNFTVNAVENQDSGVQKVATFTDPAGPGDTDYTATINWGDGTPTDTATLANGGIVDAGTVNGAENFTVQGHHKYLTSGVLPITVSVTHGAQAPIAVSSTANVSGDVVITDTTGGKNLTVFRTTPGGPVGDITYILGANPPVALKHVHSLTYNGQAGGDSMTVKDANGVPLVTGGLFFNGGQSPDTLTIEAAGQPLRTVPGGRISAGDVAPQLTGYSNTQAIFLNNASAVNAIAGPDTADRATAFAGLSAHERFVQAVYLDELGRAGTKAELDGWVALFGGAGGPQTQAQAAIATGIQGSQEAQDHLVKSWYLAYLGRAADGQEEQGWVNQLMAGQREEQVLSQILASPEFYSRAQTLIPTGTPDERYVQSLYLLLLDRSGTSDEAAGHIANAAQGNRQSVALAFLQSTEFRTDQFEGYYNALLHRPDDAGGLNGWVFSNLDVGAVRIGFESTGEFFANG